MIGIKQMRLDSLSMTKGEQGPAISGQYSLISTVDKVVATQSFGGGYGGVKMQHSPETMKALDSLLACVQKDMNALIGME